MAGNPVMGPANRAVESTEVFPETGYQVFIVRLAPKGYLVLNTDSELPLIVSFSADSSVVLDDVPENAFRTMLLRHSERMEALLRQPATLALLRQPANPLAVTELYGPFMQTTWNQCNPYNQLCPADPAGTEYYGYRAPAGCVPVAYAQVMNFHRWPLHGMGSHTYTDSAGTITGTHSAEFSDRYDWGSIRNAYDPFNDNPAAPESAVAELMYELGVAVEADYEHGGTASVTRNLGNRLGEFFYFEPSAWQESQVALITPLEADLRAGFPCVVTIPGHAIVADGLMVDSTVTTYHINYGWGGSNNGWWNANTVPGGALGSGATSLRPQLLAFSAADAITGTVDSAELQWVLPKQRETEAEKLTIFRLEEQVDPWQSDAATLNAKINSGWQVKAAGYSGDCWYAGPNGPAAMVLDEILIPDASSTLTFWSHYHLGTATFTVSVSTNDGLSFVEIFTDNNCNVSSWQQVSLPLADFAGAPTRLRFALSSGSYYTSGGVWIDSLSLNSGSWLDWTSFFVDDTLASHRFSAVTTELDDCDDFSVFEVTSSDSYKDWICATADGADSCFYKQPGGYSNRDYHLTSLTTITPTATTRLLLRAKYKLSSDGFLVLVSTDNITFTELWAAAAAADWGEIAVDLGAYAGQPIYVRLEYLVGGYYSDGGVWIDTISTQETTNPELEGQPIHYTTATNLPAGIHTLAAKITDSNDVVHALAPSFSLIVYDNDGMPAEWEALHGFDPFVNDGHLDADGDGYTNLQEYIAGTHPGDSNSFFRIAIEGKTITWPALANRTYRVLKADELKSSFELLQSVDGPTSNFTDNASVTQRFYRVSVEL